MIGPKMKNKTKWFKNQTITEGSFLCKLALPLFEPIQQSNLDFRNIMRNAGTLLKEDEMEISSDELSSESNDNVE